MDSTKTKELGPNPGDASGVRHGMRTGGYQNSIIGGDCQGSIKEQIILVSKASKSFALSKIYIHIVLLMTCILSLIVFQFHSLPMLMPS